MQRNAIYWAFYMRRARAIIHYAITCALRDSTSSPGSRVDIYTDTTTQWKIECHAASSLPQMMECLKARYRTFIRGVWVPWGKEKWANRVDWLNCSAWLNFSLNVNRRASNTIEKQVYKTLELEINNHYERAKKILHKFQKSIWFSANGQQVVAIKLSF